MRYYSERRPVGPGTFPKPEGNKILNIHNYDEKTYCEELDRSVWGYIDYEKPLPRDLSDCYDLTPEGKLWFPVTVSSRKRGGGLRVFSGKPLRWPVRPEGYSKESKKMELKTRYFGSPMEAERAMYLLQDLDTTIERVRLSATQGEVKVFFNGVYISSFGDKIEIRRQLDDPEDFYGEAIGDWLSTKPDSSFVLGFIWHPLDHTYHYGDKICEKLGRPELKAIWG